MGPGAAINPSSCGNFRERLKSRRADDGVPQKIFNVKRGKSFGCEAGEDGFFGARCAPQNDSADKPAAFHTGFGA